MVLNIYLGMQCHNNCPTSPIIPEFTKENTLPGSQIEFSIGNWYG